MVDQRYTLPAEMGGHEVAVREINRDSGRWHVEWLVPDPQDSEVGSLVEAWLPAHLLVMIERPSEPEEPPNGAKVEAGGLIYRRDAYGDHSGDRWFFGGSIAMPGCTWAEVVKLAKPGLPVVLVESPFAEPVELPWQRDLGRAAIGVGLGSAGEVWVEVKSGGRAILPILSPDLARDFARAVWAAVNQADKDGDHD